MSLKATRRTALVWIGAFPAAAAAGTQMTIATGRPDTSEWDRRLDRYLDAREAHDDDLKHGALRAAYQIHAAGGDCEAMIEAEELHHETFGVPREAALHELMLTAAPTMLALRQKVWIAQTELIDEVGDDRRPILSVVADDLTRLAATGKGVSRG